MCSSDLFIKRNYKKVAIYGFASIGKHLYEELKDSPVEVVCAIDQRPGLRHSDLKIINSMDGMPECNVIVVTVVQGGERIVQELRCCVDKTVVMLWQVIVESCRTGVV